jgi:hypothetical protein
VFEQDLLDEEIKKKKRRVLIALLILFLLVALAALPRPGLRAPSPTVVAQGTATATHLPPSPSLPPSGGDRGGGPTPFTPSVEAKATSSPMATSGAGGTTLIATGTASGAGGAERPGTPPVGAGTPDLTLSATVITGVKGTLGAGETPAGGVGGGTPGTTLSATAITEVEGTPGAEETPAGGAGGGTPGTTLSATAITEVEGTLGAEETPAGGAGGGTPGVTSTTTATAEGEGGLGMGGTPVGVGGGTPSATTTATSISPSGTGLATSTVVPPGELPVTGVTRTSVPLWLALGLVLLLLGAGTAARHDVAPGRRIR